MNKMQAHTAAWVHVGRSIFFVLTLFLIVGQAHAQRAIPDDNLAYPVLITVKTRTGGGIASGFYLNTDRAVYFVTAKHVLADAVLPEAEAELLSYSKDLPTPKPILLSLNLSTLRQNGDVKLHPSQDVAVVRLATAASKLNNGEKHRPISFLDGVTPRSNAESGLVGVPLAAVKTFDQVLVGNDALMYGYPASLNITEALFYDVNRPLLRKALVAGKDAQRQTIILDGASYHGNSGGPAFQIERDGSTSHFYCIGVDISHISLVETAREQNNDLQLQVRFNSGYAVLKPMDFVLELINEDIANENVKLPAMAAISKSPNVSRDVDEIKEDVAKENVKSPAVDAISKSPNVSRVVSETPKRPVETRITGAMAKHPKVQRKTQAHRMLKVDEGFNWRHQGQ